MTFRDTGLLQKSLSPLGWCPYKEGTLRQDTDVHEGRRQEGAQEQCPTQMEAGNGQMFLEAKSRQRPPEKQKLGEDHRAVPSPRARKEATVLTP